MRILFACPLTSFVRHFDSVILALAARGHVIRIATPGRQTNWPLPEPLAAHPHVSEVTSPGRRTDEWADAATTFRLLVDYQRFLDRPFVDASKLRARAFAELRSELTGGQLRRIVARCPSCRAKFVDDALGRLLLTFHGPVAPIAKELIAAIEQRIPPDPAWGRFLQEERPDVVLVTPLVGFGSEQPEVVKAARARGIPVGFPVFSWDNLTTKGVVHEQPDRVFVWNEIQKREAVDYHGVSEDAITITGAPRFDAFLQLAPKRDRATYCAKYGLDPTRPIVAYLCSSDFVAEGEAAFVGTWISELRRDPVLAGCNIVIRPHPRSEQQWNAVDLSAFPRVAIAKPKLLNADRSLYETLHHSAVVVGLNTSAQIEAGLLDKPVLTLLAPGFERGQQETLHFRYLLEEEGGFVKVAGDFDEHCRQVADAVAGRHDLGPTRTFIERFVRPAGMDRPATPILADAIERLGPATPLSGIAKWFKPVVSTSSRRPGERTENADRLAELVAALAEAPASCPACGTRLTAAERHDLIEAIGESGMRTCQNLLRLLGVMAAA